MRLPFLQIDGDFITQRARTVAALLGCSHAQAVGHLSLLWAWMLSQGSDDAPPSGLITGQHAARIVRAAAGWEGAAEAFVDVLSDPGVRLLERLPDGFRVRGMERYRKAWDKQRKDRDRKADVRRNSSGHPADGAGKTQTQTQTQTQKEETASQAPAVAAPPSGDLPDATDESEEVQPPLLRVATPAERPEDLQALWNAEAHASLPRWQGMSLKRRQQASARLRERPLSSWREVILRLSASPFCRGEERGSAWRASPDWLLQPDVADKVLEGKYDRPGAQASTATPPKPTKFTTL